MTDWLTGREACAYLRYSESQLPTLLAAGMPHVRMGARGAY